MGRQSDSCASGRTASGSTRAAIHNERRCMMAEASLLAWLGRIALKAFDGLLGRYRSRRKRRDEFEALRNSVLRLSTINHYPCELKKLREFVLSQGLLDDPEVEVFFTRWLASPWVERGEAALNVFTRKEIEQLTADLRALRI